jgi:tRNA threonylcarbamoyladenosine biosynthesis protein TsaB
MHAVYWGAYCLGNEGMMIPIQPDALSEPNEVFLPTERTWCATGNGWQIYQPYLSAILPHCQKVILDVFPQASALARIAEVYYQQGKILDPMQAEPTYLRDKVTVS